MQNRGAKRRLLFAPPSYLAGAEREAQVSDFESITKKAMGEGAFGEVYKVRHKQTKEMYAIKVVSKSKVIKSNLLPQLRREIRIMYSLKHPHVINLYNHFEDDSNFYLVLELAQGGTLWHKLNRFKTFDEPTTAQYLREVILAIEYLHSRDPPIIHRDIKPENLLLDKEGREGRIKVADFGWSNFFNPDRTRNTYCGTLDYLAPEMINQDGHSTSLDIWNLGVLLFELLTGTAPFQAPTQAAMFEKILKVKINFPKSFPPLAKDLVLKLLRNNPEERMPLKEILQHPWMQYNTPIRETITQELKKEPLPCSLEPTGTEVNTEDPIKPFEESEYKVLTKEETPQSEPEPAQKEPPPASSNYTEQLSILESELKHTKEENKKYKDTLQEKENEYQTMQSKIKELQSALTKLETDCQNKKQVEKSLKEQLNQKTNKIAELKALQEDENKLYQEYERVRSKCLEKETELTLLKTEIENMEKLSEEKNQQTQDLDKEIQKVKDEIDSTKQKYSKTKSEMQEQYLQLSTDVELLQNELHSKERDSSVVSLESLLTYTQENLEILQKRSRIENELLKQYQEASERLAQLDNKYTEMKLQYDKDLAEIKKKSEKEMLDLEQNAMKGTGDSDPEADLELLKQRLKESLGNQHKNKAMHDEFQQLQARTEVCERSLQFSKKHLEDLEFLKQNDEKVYHKKLKTLEGYKQELQEYKRKLGEI